MNIPMLFIYLINGLFLFGVAYFTYHKLDGSKLQKYFIPTFLFKISCTVSIGLLYTMYFEGGDIIFYFSSAQKLSQLPFGDYYHEIFSSTLLNAPRRAIYFTRIVSILLVLTKSDFWLASFYFSFIVFLSTFYFLGQINRIYPKILLPAVLSFSLFPSVIFWTSGLLKESLMFACMLYLMGLAIKISNRFKISYLEIGVAFLSAFLLALIKYYIAVAFFPLLLMYLFIPFKEKMSNIKWYSILFGMMLLAVFCLPYLHPNFNPRIFFHALEIARTTLLSSTSEEVAILLYTGSNGIVNIIFNFFILLVSGIFRPFIFESSQLLMVVASIETLIISILFMTRFTAPIRVAREYLPTMLLIAGYVIFMALSLTYSTPNFGTLARFKVYYMPFFLFLVLWNHPIIIWLKGLKQSTSLD